MHKLDFFSKWDPKLFYKIEIKLIKWNKNKGLRLNEYDTTTKKKIIKDKNRETLSKGNKEWLK